MPCCVSPVVPCITKRSVRLSGALRAVIDIMKVRLEVGGDGYGSSCRRRCKHLGESELRANCSQSVNGCVHLPAGILHL